jgi:hypothetical protein
MSNSNWTPKDYMIAGVIGIGAATGGYFLVKKIIGDSKQKGFDKAVTANSQSPEAVAEQLHRAFNPGFSALEGWVDEDAVFNVARAIKSLGGRQFLERVNAAFRNGYGLSLPTELQSELNNDEVQKFYDIIDGRLSGVLTKILPKPKKQNMGNIVQAFKKTAVRDKNGKLKRYAYPDEYLGLHVPVSGQPDKIFFRWNGQTCYINSSDSLLY